MNNLVDAILSKVEGFASKPSRLMVIADALLNRVAPKGVASAACPTWYESCTVCVSNGCYGFPGLQSKYSGTRLCWFQSSACNVKVCNPCPHTNFLGCC